ncbi:DUF805 domain-containing protein [Trinickia fusca]|nr:DUF805 domain-containing protein [Trinickia fusca]
MSFISLFSAFFLTRGRIGRSEWLTRLVIAALTCAAFGSLAGTTFGERGEDLFAVLFIWCAVALAIRRLHDVGRPGTALFIVVVPILGPVWILIQLFKRGLAHPNRFGTDPASRDDYLQVNIAE